MRMLDNTQKPDDFAVTAQVSLVEQRFRTLKHNDMFGVCGPGPAAPKASISTTRAISRSWNS
jgi:hypothetical protein